MTGRELRRMRGSMSQARFAVLVGVSQPQVSIYERAGRREVPARPATVQRILEALANDERPTEADTSTER